MNLFSPAHHGLNVALQFGSIRVPSDKVTIRSHEDGRRKQRRRALVVEFEMISDRFGLTRRQRTIAFEL